MADTLTISLTGPLAEKVRAAAETCGLSVDDWAALALKRRMAIDRETLARRDDDKTNSSD